MGKVHGSLARAGKVKSQTPKVEAQEKTKTPKGRALKRLKYTRRFVNVTLTGGKRKVSRFDETQQQENMGADDAKTDEPQPRLLNNWINDRNYGSGMLTFGHGSTQQWLLHSVMG
ncbi:40S ribosomal protein S30 [Fusarium torreyae]|uniref:40S ribosomal protein S30 n=1 Tax=Fusarium torreyae TaxID=1237075 RepID=A0A9W8S6P6_9HYPO|nr:40S ribosomal protein S30 [Fusarium torreyae]